MRAGDPTWLGWTAVAAYLIAAALCVVTARTADRADRQIWLILACILALLAGNKQLDLQSVFTQLARELAMAGGWYERRRQAQLAFLAALALAGAVILATIAVRMRGSRTGLKLALVGLACLFLFVLGRAASFHHVDAALGWDVGPLKFTIVPELIGSLLIGAGAVRAGRSKRAN